MDRESVEEEEGVRSALRLCCATLALALAVLSSGIGCSPDSDGAAGAGGSSASTCTREFVGDPSKPLEFEITYRGNDGLVHALAEGGRVPLVTPPQGGKVLFVGVRARNLSPCGVELVGALRDPTTAKVTIDGRSGLTLADDGGGWVASDNGAIANFANISACPNQWASVDIFDKPFSLAVTLTTTGPTKLGDDTTIEKRKKEVVITVTPDCDGDTSGATACTCVCKAGYSLGQVCN